MASLSAADQAWFFVKVQLEHSRLRATIRSLGVRADAVDDIAQDAFLVALDKLSEFERGGDFGGWVRQIARRLVANERRKEGRRGRILSERVTDLLLDGPLEFMNPVLGKDRTDLLAALKSCVGKLPPESQEILIQRYFKDDSPGAIAGRLGQTSNRVRQTLLRLRRSLLDCIERRLGVEAGT